MKKLISLLMALVLVCALACVPAFADDSATATVTVTSSAAEATAGSTVTFTVAVAETNVAAMSLTVDAGSMTADLSSDYGYTVAADTASDPTDGVTKVSYAAGSVINVIDINCISGNIATVTCTIPADAAAGTVYTLSVSGIAYDLEGTELTCSAGSAAVTVVEAPSYIVGDANGDGKITLFDAVTIAQYKAGMTVTINTSAADANGDGKITLFDAVTIAQYKAGIITSLPRA